MEILLIICIVGIFVLACLVYMNLKKFKEMETIVLQNIKMNLLEATTSLNKEQFNNNEKLLNQFNNFSQNLGNVMGENNQRLGNTINENNQLLSKIMNENNQNINKVMSENNQNISLNINKFKDELKKNMNEDFEGLNNKVEIRLTEMNDKIEKRLDMMNMKVEERLSKGFEETTKTFGNILERLSKIDEAQKKIEALSTNVVSLQDVLTDKKSRGIFGEVQLYQILASVFGEKNDSMYQKQYKLSNGTMVDAILFTPEPMGNIAIDSKFPLENYRRLYDINLSNEEKEQARKEFVSDMKKHIDAISSKYIIKDETSDQAILFLPAEAIFAEINAYHLDILDYAFKRNVRIASPTTLMSVLTMIQMIMKNMEREKHASIIQKELMKLHDEFVRYDARWKTLSKDIDKITKDVKEITTTSDKISKRFNEISNVKMEEKENLKLM